LLLLFEICCQKEDSPYLQASVLLSPHYEETIEVGRLYQHTKGIWRRGCANEVASIKTTPKLSSSIGQHRIANLMNTLQTRVCERHSDDTAFQCCSSTNTTRLRSARLAPPRSKRSHRSKIHVDIAATRCQLLNATAYSGVQTFTA
jgi:hypothetical protein